MSRILYKNKIKYIQCPKCHTWRNIELSPNCPICAERRYLANIPKKIKRELLKRKEYMRRYKKEHLEKLRNYKRAYRARKRAEARNKGLLFP